MSDKVSTFAQRLRECLDVRQMTQSELAKRSGISKSSISRYIKGDWEGKQSAVYGLAKALGVTEAWLMGYDVPMEGDSGAAVPAGFDPLPEMAQVPLVGRIACGQPITAEENVEGYVSIPSAWRATFTLMCEGDSMAPCIQDGDLVAIRKQAVVENGEIAAVRIEDEATLKRVYVYPDHIVLQPENRQYEPIVLIGEDMNTVSIEGKAVGFCRGL